MPKLEEISDRTQLKTAELGCTGNSCRVVPKQMRTYEHVARHWKREDAVGIPNSCRIRNSCRIPNSCLRSTLCYHFQPLTSNPFFNGYIGYQLGLMPDLTKWDDVTVLLIRLTFFQSDYHQHSFLKLSPTRYPTARWLNDRTTTRLRESAQSIHTITCNH
jgi:hypothetical protein